MGNKVAVLLLFCLLTVFSLHAQERLWFDKINIDDGLSQSTVLSMLQDRQGFIWIGTQYGLNRFDGYQFEIFTHDIVDANSLSSNFIITLFEDSSGLLWIGTNNGLNVFDKTTHQIKRYLHDTNDKNSISHNLISSIAEDELGNIWIGTAGGGLNKFDKVSQVFEKITIQSDNSNNSNPLFITNLLLDHNGLLWVTSGKARLRPTNEQGGILVLNPKTLSFKQVTPIIADKVLNIDSVTSIFLDDKNNLWFGTLRNGLLKKQFDSNKFSQSFKEEVKLGNPITAITQDRSGQLWFATQYSGIYRYDFFKNNLTNYNSTSPENSNLQVDDIVSLLIDKTGVFWMGSWTGGINKLDLDSFQFQKYLQLASKNHPAQPSILDINQDSHGGTWLAARASGLIKIDLTTGISTKPAILDSGVVGIARHVFVDRHDKIWLGTSDKGMVYYDPENESYKSFKHNPLEINSLSNNTVIQIIDEPSGNLWIATRGGGLNYFNVKEQKFSHYVHEKSDKTSLADDRIRALYLDEKGFLWVGTSIGLDIFDPNKRRVLAHYQGGTEKESFIGNAINTIFNDRSGQVWIGTEKGVSKVNFDNDARLDKLTFSWDIGFGKSQLGSVGGILDDANGNLWISSFKYISRYNPETQEVKNYNSSSGVLSGGYYVGSSHQDKNGTLYFGGLGGLTAFKPEEKAHKTMAPQTVITRLLLFNQPVYADGSDEASLLKQSIDKTKELNFNYKQNVFSLEFSALHYSSAKDNKYAYKLEGFNKQWVYTDSHNRRATYTNLDAGVYRFFLRASNNEGVWSQTEEKLVIRVHAAPWETSLAYFVYLLLMAMIISSFIWLRFKQVQAIKLRNEQLSLTSKLFENTSECVWLLDDDLNFLTVNKGFCNVTGFNESETIGQKIHIASVKGQNQDLIREIIKNVKSGGRWEGEMWAQRKNGEVFPIDIVIDRVDLKNAQGEISGYQFVGIFSDITLRTKAEEDLRFLAFYDRLTGLPNRAYFHTLVQEQINKKLIANEFIVFYLDLDNFKNINDSLGHSYGDELLVTLANRLEDYSDKKYTIARLGGDEFALMATFNGTPESLSQQVKQIGNEILKLIRKNVVLKNHSLHVSTSIGITIYPYDGKNYEELYRNADTAMYDVKNRGGNGFTLYSKNMNKAARQRLMLEDKLNKAIISDEIIPYYQPKVSLETGKIYGLEVLARWNHQELGWVSPKQFIPVAEESKLINKISDQLLSQACQFLLPTIEKGGFEGRMSFNLSMTQFLQGDIVSRIDGIIEECGFPAEYLEIEVTESMVMKNINQAIEIMKQFKNRNINIAIDDFGTGYSSLSYLKKFPIDTLKIDISFIRDLTHSQADEKIVTSIIQLAHNLGLTVVAEGGETIEQILILKKLGCELLQGYYYSRPLSGDDYLSFLSTNKNLYS